jgi:hypothetical protein
MKQSGSVSQDPGDRAPGGQFVVSAKALHDNPFDAHTLRPTITQLEGLTGVGTRSHPCRQGLLRLQPRRKVPRLDQRPSQPPHCYERREMKCRAAVETVIGHLKAEHRMGQSSPGSGRRPRQRRASCCGLQLRTALAPGRCGFRAPSYKHSYWRPVAARQSPRRRQTVLQRRHNRAEPRVHTRSKSVRSVTGRR